MSDEVKIPLPRSLQDIVGALLFASETPLTSADLRSAIKAVEPEEGENAEVMEVYRTCTGREIEAALKGLEKALEVAGCGFQLVCTGGAYRIQTVASCGRYVRALLKLDRPNRLGRASLETLAIVAYRQPLTKSEIEEIRGVDVSANIKTLMDLQLIRLVGKSELPGHPFLYGTTPLFLDHFGLSSLQQLNELDPTLQRSNPRTKAAAYRRPVAETPLLDQPAAGEPTEDGKPSEESEAKDKPSQAKEEVAESVPELDLGSSEVVGAEISVDDDEDETSEDEMSESEAPAKFKLGDDDDDLLIDDTEDEFDEDEDDEEDEGEGEGEGDGGEEDE